MISLICRDLDLFMIKNEHYLQNEGTISSHNHIHRVKGAVDKIYSSSALPAKACGNLFPYANLAMVYKYKQADRKS
jgi:hypothetical protein